MQDGKTIFTYIDEGKIINKEIVCRLWNLDSKR